MFGGLFCIGFGLAMVALVIFGDRSVNNAKHTGVKVSAQVIGQEVEVGAKGSRFYHAKVRFPDPMASLVFGVGIGLLFVALGIFFIVMG